MERREQAFQLTPAVVGGASFPMLFPTVTRAHDAIGAEAPPTCSHGLSRARVVFHAVAWPSGEEPKKSPASDRAERRWNSVPDVHSCRVAECMVPAGHAGWRRGVL